MKRHDLEARTNIEIYSGGKPEDKGEKEEDNVGFDPGNVNGFGYADPMPSVMFPEEDIPMDDSYKENKMGFLADVKINPASHYLLNETCGFLATAITKEAQIEMMKKAYEALGIEVKIEYEECPVPVQDLPPERSLGFNAHVEKNKYDSQTKPIGFGAKVKSNQEWKDERIESRSISGLSEDEMNEASLVKCIEDSQTRYAKNMEYASKEKKRMAGFTATPESTRPYTSKAKKKVGFV